MLQKIFSKKAYGLNNSAPNHKNKEITVIVPSDCKKWCSSSVFFHFPVYIFLNEDLLKKQNDIRQEDLFYE